MPIGSFYENNKFVCHKNTMDKNTANFMFLCKMEHYTAYNQIKINKYLYVVKFTVIRLKLCSFIYEIIS